MMKICRDCRHVFILPLERCRNENHSEPILSAVFLVDRYHFPATLFSFGLFANLWSFSILWYGKLLI